MAAMKAIGRLAVVGLLVGATAAIGGHFTSSSVGSWYAGLEKPGFTPPGWVFGPVWTVLYVAMAVAAWLVWQRHGLDGASVALGLFVVQLVLNAGWSWLFFGRRNPGAAFVEILVLEAAVIATGVLFWRRHRAAGLLFLPYALWVGYAAVLNLRLWQLNA